MEPQSNQQSVGTHKGVFVLAVIVLASLVFGAAWLLGSRNVVPVISEKNISHTAVEWKQPKDFKILPPQGVVDTSRPDAALITFAIGNITEGKFKGKTIAMTMTKSSFNSLKNGSHVYDYYYSVVDAQGKLVAWDKNFYHISGLYFDEESPFHISKTGLIDSLEQSLADLLPIEASIKKDFEFRDKGKFIPSISLSFESSESLTDVKVGVTDSGFDVIKGAPTQYQDTSTPFPISSYRVRLPFGVLYYFSPEPDFVDTNDVPQLTWTLGTTTVASYRYGQYAYGWQDCYETLPKNLFEASLIPTGITVTKDTVYEVDAARYPKVYACLHEKTKRYVYNPETETGEYKETITYAEFITTHPMFFWKHQIGEWIAFVRSDVVPAAEKAKPVIYLYPTKSEKVNVKVAPIGGFTVTDPEYGNGWLVQAEPNGVLTNIADGKQYPYLFWEGGEEGIVATPKEGFVVKKEDVEVTLNEKLALFGLNDQERADFLEFWVPRLSRTPYYFITFISESEIDRTAPMSVSPAPDSVIRILMDYKPLEKAITVTPLSITPKERKGFTVVEWGGIIRD